ncbi:hypothetical protein B4135_2160 [Caldibacillus debilis]|uniref:Uncharacterized protein n=1 Tax=Caldibacillus debilis TaxID=301148 RepID=A0A150M4E1_9BACI|nr:hypothetical protein B4135_2160 [Caldibacillus debilis]
MSEIFTNWFIILTITFIIEKNLSNMKEKMIIIPKKTSITAGKMSIIASGVQHRGRLA